jgi:hypothetical protein
MTSQYNGKEGTQRLRKRKGGIHFSGVTFHCVSRKPESIKKCINAEER